MGETGQSVPLVRPVRVLVSEFLAQVHDKNMSHLIMPFFLHDLVAGLPVVLPTAAPLHVTAPPALDAVVDFLGME